LPLPPKWIRRLVLAPLVLLVSLGLVATMPVWMLLAGLAAPLGSGRFRALRVLWMVTVYLLVEAVALVVLCGLWIASGFGTAIRSPRYQRVHYALVGWFLRTLYRQARWALHVRVVIVGPDPDLAAPGRPELVFCRHAGPGDSFLLVHALVNWFDREPRIVLKDTLQWDPVIDVMLNRLPSRFITAGGPTTVGPTTVGPTTVGPTSGWSDAEAHIAALATGLDANDALVLFPEGGNFTPSRRTRAIERLRRLGLHAMADRAERMRYVLAPRPGGTLAALDAAPEAGVVWVGHTGLDRLLTIADVWRQLPLDTTITMRWWSVPAADVPVGREARVEWLFQWWTRIDDWIGTHSPPTAEPRSRGRSAGS
jgi:1-acyl-sn-glycerol-3-phosphate acyltransferase